MSNVQGISKRGVKGAAGTTPPANLYECQNKGFTEFAFRKYLILKGTFLVVLEEQEPKIQSKKKKSRGSAPALQIEFYRRRPSPSRFRFWADQHTRGERSSDSSAGLLPDHPFAFSGDRLLFAY